MLKQTTLVSLLVLLSTTACTLAPNYSRPDMPVAQNWSDTVQEITESAPLPGWQTFFTTPELQQVIKTALANNRDLRIATLNVAAVRAAYGIQRADLLPTINAEGTLTTARTPENASSTGQADTSRSYNANLASTAYELDLFGRVRSLNKAAFESWLASVSAQQSAHISLVAEVTNTYLQWLTDKDILALTEETLANQQKTFELVETNYENGLVGKLDVAQARQAVEAARANTALYTRRVAQGRNALVLLLGTPQFPEALQNADTSLNSLNITTELPVGLPAEVLLNRPDIQQAEHTLKSMNANIGAARAAFLPSISLTGSYGFASNDLSDLFSAGSQNAWSFTPAISLPIFSARRNLLNLRASKARRDIALAQYEKAIQTGFKEVADALSGLQTLSQQQKAQQALVAAAQEAYDISKIRYDEGVDRFLTVLDAQRTLYEAQTVALQLQQQVLANNVTLYKVLGGGLNPNSTEQN